MRLRASSAAARLTDAITTVPSSLMSMVVPVSSVIERITAPPLPITSRILSGLILMVSRRGAYSLSSPRGLLSEYAPRLLTIKIHPDKIREVIGKGGAVIRSITEETGTTIDISDDGTVVIASVNRAAAEDARKRIEQIVSDVEPGRIYEGKVVKLMDFGAFVTILPGKDGLVHVSQISNERVEKVSDKLKEGDIVKVKVLEVDKQGRIRLSMKAVTEEERTATSA